MKKFNFLSMVLCALILSASLVGCTRASDKEELPPDPDPVPVDYGTAVSGTYIGKLKMDNEVIEDAYVVKVIRIASKAVTVAADFYPRTSGGGQGSANYNVSLDGTQYIFSSESSSGITISVAGRSITISFLNQGGGMTTYTGTKD
jgi:hypothetical protein